MWAGETAGATQGGAGWPAWLGRSRASELMKKRVRAAGRAQSMEGHWASSWSWYFFLVNMKEVLESCEQGVTWCSPCLGNSTAVVQRPYDCCGLGDQGEAVEILWMRNQAAWPGVAVQGINVVGCRMSFQAGAKGVVNKANGMVMLWEKRSEGGQKGLWPEWWGEWSCLSVLSIHSVGRHYGAKTIMRLSRSLLWRSFYL